MIDQTGSILTEVVKRRPSAKAEIFWAGEKAEDTQNPERFLSAASFLSLTGEHVVAVAC